MNQKLTFNLGRSGRDVNIDAERRALNRNCTPRKVGRNTIKIDIRHIILCLLLINYVQVDAQDATYAWAKSVGGVTHDQGRAVAVDTRGNVFVTGYFGGSANFNPSGPGGVLTASSNQNIFLAKYDSEGNYIWAKSIGGNGSASAYGIAVDPRGNIFLTGTFSGTIDLDPDTGTASFTPAIVPFFRDAFLAKYDSNGRYLWGKSMGGGSDDEGHCVAVDTGGNVYVSGFHTQSINFNPGGTGGTLSPLGGGNDIFLAKYDTNGTYLWAKNMGGSGADHSNGLAVDISGNVYMTGYFEGRATFNVGGLFGSYLTSAGNRDIFLAKYSTSGNYLWAKNMGSDGDDEGRGVALDATGNVYITGDFQGTANFNINGTGGSLTSSGSWDVFIAKYSPSGIYMWAKNAGGNLADHSWDIAVDGSDNIYVTGNYLQNFNPGNSNNNLNASGGENVFIARYDADGSNQWAKGVGGNANALAVDSRGGIYATGWYNQVADFDPGPDTAAFTSAGGMDAFLLKLKQHCEVTVSFFESICDSYTFNGITYTKTGEYADTFISASGCDSIYKLTLTITGNTSDNPVIKGDYCDSATFNGVTYTTSGIYTQSYNNSKGCDSSITYDINIAYHNTHLLSYETCNSFMFNDTVYWHSGTYSTIFTNLDGCDSIMTLKLTINNAEASVTKNGTTLIVNSADSYQWLNCDSSIAITGANSQHYTPKHNGHYAVIITSNSCIDTSDCILVEVESRIDELYAGNVIQIFPNPGHNRLNIQAGKALKNATIKMVNVVGQLIEERINQYGTHFSMDILQYSAGVYFVEVSEDGHVLQLKFVKE